MTNKRVRTVSDKLKGLLTTATAINAALNLASTKKVNYNEMITKRQRVGIRNQYRRKNINPDGFTETAMQHAGQSNTNSYKNSKTIILNKRRQSASQMQRSIINMMKCSLVSRWQYLHTLANPYTQNTFGLSILQPMLCLQKQVANAAGDIWLPVFAINLTSMARNLTSACKTAPVYRLKKVITATGAVDAATKNYVWTNHTLPAEALGGQTFDGTSLSDTWEIEKDSGNNSIQAPRTHNHYLLEWVTANLAFYSQEQTKIHLSTISFNNPEAGPKRQYYAGGWVTFDDDETLSTTKHEDTCAADLWWDHYLARKLVHPIRSVDQINDSKAVQFHTTECICLDGASVPTAHKAVFKKSLYFPFKQMFSCQDITNQEAAHNPAINTALQSNFPVPTYNVSNVQSYQTMFPARTKDVWLLIHADDFNGPSAYDNGLTARGTCPLFDIVVRQKVTVSTL